MTIDITQVVLALLGILFAALTLLAVKGNKYLKEKLTEKQITIIKELVYEVVHAAEQKFESGECAQKLAYAVERVTSMLLDYGIKLDVESIKAYIESAVLEINNSLWDYDYTVYDGEEDSEELSDPEYSVED